MFAGGLQADELKVEVQGHFRNISLVMDCVGCEKCKLWGKLQITGLGTALKILFSSPSEDENQDITSLKQIFVNSSDSLIDPALSNLRLSRNEIVALFNAFGRLSTSI